MPGRFGWKLLMMVWAAALPAVAQEKVPVPDDQVPQYDIVSIKPNKSGSGHVSVTIDDGNYSATNVGLKQLLADAYGIRPNLIGGLPGWANSAAYDIRAKMLVYDTALLSRLSPAQWRMVMQPILARFDVKTHVEVKTLPVYELVVMKDGPKFHKADADKPFEGYAHSGTHTENTHLVAHDVSLEGLIAQIETVTNRDVVDKTGLTGKYDLDLKWTRDEVAAAQAADPTKTNNDAPPVMVTALQEQLGLKLVPAKGPVKTLVVDSVSPPAED